MVNDLVCDKCGLGLTIDDLVGRSVVDVAEILSIVLAHAFHTCGTTGFTVDRDSATLPTMGKELGLYPFCMTR